MFYVVHTLIQVINSVLPTILPLTQPITYHSTLISRNLMLPNDLAMKYTWLLLLLFVLPAHAQTSGDGTQEINYDNVAGDQFLFKDWCDGVIKFTSGRVVTQFKLKFNCLKNQLLLQFNGSAFAAESKVREFIMYEKGKGKDSMIFRKGYPAADKATGDTYYQVLFEGKVTLLRLISKNIIEQKEIVNSSTTRRLEDEELYYLLENGKMTSLPLDKNQLPQALPSKADQIAQFISSEQIKLRGPGDMLKVIKKYNELL